MITADVDKDRPLLNVEEAGELLGLSRATMYRAIHPAGRWSGSWTVSLSRPLYDRPGRPTLDGRPRTWVREDRVNLADGTAE